MPAGRPFSQLTEVILSQDDQATTQTKRCSTCQRPLNADTTPVLSPPYPPESSESASFCAACREARLLPRTPLVVCSTISPVDKDGESDIDVPRHVLCDTRADGIPMLIESDSSSSDEDVDLPDQQRKIPGIDKSRQIHTIGVSQSSHVVPVLVPASPLHHQYPQRNPSPVSISPTFHHIPQTYSSTGETSSPRHNNDHDHDDGYPDAFVDITRLRVRSRGYKCLQPGATFKGTQKSGRNSYDVNVTIVVSRKDQSSSPLLVAHECPCFPRTLTFRPLSCAVTYASAD